MTGPNLEALDDLDSFEALFSVRLNLPWTYGDEIAVMEEHFPGLASAWKLSTQLGECLHALAGSVSGGQELRRMLEQASTPELDSRNPAEIRQYVPQLLDQLTVHNQVLRCMIDAWSRGDRANYAELSETLAVADQPGPDDSDLAESLHEALSDQREALLALARCLDAALAAQT
jgi:hypothetical protein